MNSSKLSKVIANTLQNSLITIIVKSRAGCGKSEIINSVGRNLNWKQTEPIIPAILNAIDVNGLPTVVNSLAEFLPFGFMRQILEAKEPTMAFIDDFGQAPESVQKALMQMLHGRAFNGFRVSDKVRFVAATNSIEDKAGINPIISPLLNRATILELHVSFSDFWEFATNGEGKGRFEPIVLAYLKLNQDSLAPEMDKQATRKIEAFATPRSWEMLSKHISIGNDIAEVFCGTVGKVEGSKFAAFYDSFLQIGGLPKQALANPFDANIPDNLSMRYAVCTALTYLVKDDTAQAANDYCARLGAEFHRAFWEIAKARTPSIANTLAYANYEAVSYTQTRG